MPNPQPGGLGFHIYEPWRQGGPAIPQGTGWIPEGYYVLQIIANVTKIYAQNLWSAEKGFKLSQIFLSILNL